MKSWKTTVGGLLAAAGAWASNQPEPWWLFKFGPLLSVVGLSLLGVTARDNGVPSSAVPTAAKADEKIKRETAFLESGK